MLLRRSLQEADWLSIDGLMISRPCRHLTEAVSLTRKEIRMPCSLADVYCSSSRSQQGWIRGHRAPAALDNAG